MKYVLNLIIIERLVSLFICLFCGFACAPLDGEVKPADGVFKITDGGNVVEANRHVIIVSPVGGKTNYCIEYGGEETCFAQIVNGKTTDGRTWELTQDCITVRLLDNIQFELTDKRWNTGVLKQTLEISAAQNESNRDRKISIILLTETGEAKLIIRQKRI